MQYIHSRNKTNAGYKNYEKSMENQKNTDNIFEECLKMAWAEAKTPAEKSKKELIMERLEMMAKAAGQRYSYMYTVYVSEWEKYGKNRTYLAVFEKSDITKHNAKIECGYFDNNADEYIPGNVDIEDRYDLCGRLL